MEGTVTSIRSVLCAVNAGGASYECTARGRLVASDTGESKPLVVGDRVVFTPTAEGEGVVEKILPRRTRLSRRSPRRHHVEHVIAANVDRLLIVASVGRPPLSMGIIDRYVIAGHAGGIEPVVCINKIDLARDESDYAGVARAYREMDYTVLLTSATERQGLDALREALRDRSTVLAGHSGVGKSSLINALQPGLKLKTGPVSTKGRHTTSSVSLLRLDFGGYVVDTPGIREFTLWDIERREVAQFFPRIWDLSPDCRLPDCLHLHEPDCAVKAALEAGELPPERYDSYARIVETVHETSVPRETDVDQPTEQVAKSKREPSRRRRKQRLRRLARQELDEEEAEDSC
jgi:ribosome biogenesis GTPase